MESQDRKDTTGKAEGWVTMIRRGGIDITGKAGVILTRQL
jgi:hypothetical protein